jgi:hypothetical protein
VFQKLLDKRSQRSVKTRGLPDQQREQPTCSESLKFWNNATLQNQFATFRERHISEVVDRTNGLIAGKGGTAEV